MAVEYCNEQTIRYAEMGRGTCEWPSCQYLLTYRTTKDEAHFELSASCSRDGVRIYRYVSEISHVTPALKDDRLFNKEGSCSGPDWTSSFLNSTLTCRFSRPLKIMFDQSSVDLSTTWFQLYAWGPLTAS
ncbi:hypothetical protein HELRODRAFT_171764 [Helobdella robusta]|uniref:Uncharacterized protein n=1 Tax=Helobdella robusta TaxID=6412 RepID=T1F4M4_HELRO|nr:hypothetical protein HELRODRAFT_171764 [Helobdella robusta]ESO05372.1 hypothetical protein HELRODRAFT_171764 [Helobdella robusta]